MWVNLLGIIALFAAAVAGLCKWFDFDTSDSPLWVQIPLAIAAVCGLIWLVFNGKNIARLATSRSARYGVNMFALTLIVAFILVMLNVVVTSQAKRWDTTQNQRNSLSQQSIQIVRNLDDDVMVTAIQPESLANETTTFANVFNSTMEMYRAESNRVGYQVVDSFNNPEAVADLPRPITPGDIYVTIGEDENRRTEKVEPYNVGNMEEKITRAVISVSRDEQKVIYFVTRREEKLFDQNAEYSLQALRSGLESQNFEVKTVDLLTEQQVPEDATVLFLADPDYQYTDADLTALTQYINRGGQVIAAVDIEPVLNGQADSALVDYLQQFGVTLGRDLVLEQAIQDMSLSGRISMGITMEFNPVSFSDTHDITKDLNTPLAYSIGRSVTADNLPEGVTAEALVMSSAMSWAEDNLDLLIAQGAANPQDSKIRESVPLAQLVSIDLTRKPAEYTGGAPVTTGNIPATLTMSSPEPGASPESTAVPPQSPLGISTQEPEMGFSLDDPPSPGGAVEDGGRPEMSSDTATDELVNIGVEDEMLLGEPDGDGTEDFMVADEDDAAGDDEATDTTPTQARLLVLGDTTMLTDRNMVPGQGGNRDFTLNAVSYLAAETDLIAIRPKDTINSGFTMSTLDQRIFIVLLFAMPLLVAIVGVMVAVRRRRLA